MTTNARDEKWSEWIPVYRESDMPKDHGIVGQWKSDDGFISSTGKLWDVDYHGPQKIIAYRYKIKEPEVTEEEEEAWKMKEMTIEEAREILSNDNVNHPQHYQSDNGIECIDAIRAALGLDGFVAHCRGTAIKYAFRAGKKQAHAEDLRKAAVYLTWAAEALEE